MAENRSKSILMIDDNESETDLARAAFADFAPGCELLFAHSVAEALAVFDSAAGIAAIFLDIYLCSRTVGWSLLDEIRARPRLRYTPVVVFSGSTNPEDVERAYRYHATCFVPKPSNFDAYCHTLETCFQFWCSVAAVPNNAEPAQGGTQPGRYATGSS